METEYFGTRESDRMIRVYNKAKEQNEPGIRTRVECQSRQEMSLENPRNFVEPFADFEIYIKDGIEGAYPGEIPIQYRALLEYLENHPNEYKELGDYTKRNIRKYKEMYKAHNYRKVDLQSIVQRDYQSCLKEIQKICGVCV